uniref:Uncharacterized protein n=1 Tax=Arundo donax TaxID=35708 RepID=A0A0A9AYJ4_ARUDO
MPLKGGASS